MAKKTQKSKSKPKVAAVASAPPDSDGEWCFSHHLTPLMHFKKTEGTLYAGALDDLEWYWDQGLLSPKLIIDLSGMAKGFDVPFPVSVNDQAAALLPDTITTAPQREPPAVLYIDWLDGSAPSGLNSEWWGNLANAIQNLDGDTAIVCMAGHGRTGTALAILADKLGLVEEESDPVEWVRDNYCDSAVESRRQLTYVEEITGKKTAERPSDFYKPVRPLPHVHSATSSVSAAVRSSLSRPDDHEQDSLGHEDGVLEDDGVYLTRGQ